MARAIRRGGRLAVSAFSAYFQLRYLEEHDAFDAEAGVNHERTIVKDEAGTDAEGDLWTTCLTPRELPPLAAGAGLHASAVWSVAPGAYRDDPPATHTTEMRLVGPRP